jgi:hypothetical protein
MIKIKNYYCEKCGYVLTLDIKAISSLKEEERLRPLLCKKCEIHYGWRVGFEKEAEDYLKQVCNFITFKEHELCEHCQATGSKNPFLDEKEICSYCNGNGFIKREEKEEKVHKKKNKGMNFGLKEAIEMRRLRATGLKVRDGKVVYIQPKSVIEEMIKIKKLKKKKRKIAEKSKKKHK